MPSETIVYALEPNVAVIAELPPDILQRAAEALSNFSPVLQNDENIMALYQQQNFADQGATFGDPWADLKPSTILDKMRKGYPLTPEVRTGLLRSQIGQAVDESDMPFGVTVGTDLGVVPYAAYQDAGAPSRNLPPRILAALVGDEIDEMQQALADFLAEQGLPADAFTITAAVGN